MDSRRTRALLISIAAVAIVTMLGLVVFVITWGGKYEREKEQFRIARQAVDETIQLADEGLAEPSRRTNAATAIHGGPDPMVNARSQQPAINKTKPRKLTNMKPKGQMNAATAIHAGPDPVANGRALQDAINNANPGDTIILDAGGNYLGPITLPVKSGTGLMITIQSSSLPYLPAAGQRVDPRRAAVMARILSPGHNAGAMNTADGAHHYTLLGLEFTSNAPTNREYAYINLGNNGIIGPYSVPQTTLAQVPHDLVVDRCYIHGLPSQDSEGHPMRGISLHSASTTIQGCYISQIQSSGADVQGIWGANGPGPYQIVNNYVEATGENIMFGGDYQKISGLTPANATIRLNHFKKPMKWNPKDPTGAWRQGENYDGSHWSIKNLLELKSGDTFVIDSNTFEGCWVSAQAGWAILFTPRAGDQGGSWTHVSNIKFTNNVIVDSAQGIDMLGSDDASASGPLQNILIQNNLFHNVGNDRFAAVDPLKQSGAYQLFYLSSGVSSGSTNVQFDHNTWIPGSTYTRIGVISYTQTGFVFTNNVIPFGRYGIYFDGHGEGLAHASGWLPGAVVSNNIIWRSDPSNPVPGNYWGSPDPNHYPASLEAVGFADHAGGNYALAPTSRYHKRALDGSDPGTRTRTSLKKMTGKDISSSP